MPHRYTSVRPPLLLVVVEEHVGLHLGGGWRCRVVFGTTDGLERPNASHDFSNVARYGGIRDIELQALAVVAEGFLKAILGKGAETSNEMRQGISRWKGQER